MTISLPAVANLKLIRYPRTDDKSLRAWSAADEYLIDFLSQINSQSCIQSFFDKGNFNQRFSLSLDRVSGRILIVNDQFGALSVTLNHYAPDYWCDSFLSNKATKINLGNNVTGEILAKPFELDYHHRQIQLTDTTTNKHHPIENNPINFSVTPRESKTIDLVVLRIPKHLSLLEFQLKQLKRWIGPDTQIVAAGMTKDIHVSTINLFESIIGPTKTSLARKKARLIISENKAPISSESDIETYRLDKSGITICGLPGVFSRDKLDIGTQVLLRHLPSFKPHQKVIDLGCGSGVIGACIARDNPDTELLLTDESALAVESSRLTFFINDLANAQFIQTNGLTDVESNQYDHVLCNPPFHQQNVQTLSIAKNMFKEAARCLKSSGELRVVANRHLKYGPILKRYFGKTSIVSKDPKFIIWLAESPR
ncbi:methyltransferase [Aliikangiella coralliicola]|uniref:Class I SAM-dependent methyltransferase n=1 Tax=Aliikangiella coralliicola TaxID=2592383 RepID=A0A545TW81_9GAMM|nr:class I SAM-dependent methyltransferase [Aliikangiella coralliicola]TQV81483.1 class I SAM-dependent methyltransferase [Aliikangiella coralliicola]